MKGLELSRAFYEALAAPLLEKLFPGMAHAAGLLGPGSDVQGFDTPVSQDHDWGPGCSSFWITGRKSGAAG